MTALQFAFVLLCLVQVLHFSQHWFRLTSNMWDNIQEARRRKAVDWKAPARRR